MRVEGTVREAEEERGKGFNYILIKIIKVKHFSIYVKIKTYFEKAMLLVPLPKP